MIWEFNQGGSRSGPHYVTSGKGKQKLCDHIPPLFEALLGKLPSFDQDWAKTQFIWGLHSRVAELVTIAGPADLHLAIRKAEEIEMPRSLASRRTNRTEDVTSESRPRQGPTSTWAI